MRFIFVVLITLIYASVPAFADYSGPFSPTGPLAFTPATIVNPTDPAYGVKCDGVADDTMPLQNWVNAVVATGAKGVLPVGTCLTTGLTIDVSAASLGIIIEGSTATITGTTCSAGEVSLPPLWHRSWESSFIHSDAIHAIASAASTPASVGSE